MTKVRSRLSRSHHQFLEQIGLSADCIALYALLLDHKNVSAQEASLALGTYPSAMYRLFYRLEDIGLIRSLGGRPRRFMAIPKATGLAAAAQIHHQSLLRLLGSRVTDKMTDLQLIIGRQALYDRYQTLAQRSAHSIDVYAIGIAYSKALQATQADVVRRGVVIRHLVQQVRPVNYHVIAKWHALGIELRHNPSARGLHVMIFDQKYALISFSDAHDTDNQLSIVTDNTAVVAQFADQFEELWQQSSLPKGLVQKTNP